MSIGVASALTMQFSACQQAQRENPLLQESTIAFGAPDFSKIQTSDYLPAFEAVVKKGKVRNEKANYKDRGFCIRRAHDIIRAFRVRRKDRKSR